MWIFAGSLRGMWEDAEVDTAAAKGPFHFQLITQLWGRGAANPDPHTARPVASSQTPTPSAVGNREEVLLPRFQTFPPKPAALAPPKTAGLGVHKF